MVLRESSSISRNLFIQDLGDVVQSEGPDHVGVLFLGTNIYCAEVLFLGMTLPHIVFMEAW